tara:strand:+ start:340 stop:444 length:105 start_codon:yes stop_codon:yes gene_type:complete
MSRYFDLNPRSAKRYPWDELEYVFCDAIVIEIAR